MILNDVSFVTPRGAVMALVARMGQGKTTFFRLALRFYAPEGGEVRIGGIANSDIPVAELRRQVVMMSQFPAFFYDTVRENLRLAKADAADVELVEWCKYTGIWSVLEKLGSPEEQERLPNPLDRQFAAGKMLGGGHRKLFALTRCLLRRPSVLLLDEPTVGMSNDEKYALIPSMLAALEGRTTLIVDHDVRWLASVCQHAVVLDGGRVAQEGSIESLLAQPGLFKELHDLGDERRVDASMTPPDHDMGFGSWASHPRDGGRYAVGIRRFSTNLHDDPCIQMFLERENLLSRLLFPLTSFVNHLAKHPARNQRGLSVH